MAETETVKTPKAGKKNTIGDFYINKLDGKVMRKFIKEHKLDIDTEDATDEQIAVGLFAHFDAKDEDHKVKCDNCDGVSSDDLKLCPYCGDEGEVEEEDEASAADAEEAEDDEEEDEDEESSDDEEEDEEEEEKPKAKKAAVKKEEEDEEDEESSDDEDEDEEEDDSEEDDDEEEDEEEEKPAKKASKKEKLAAKSKSEDEDEEDDETTIVMSEEEIEEIAPTTAPKKRGRPKGSKNKSSKEEKPAKAHLNGVSKKETSKAIVKKGSEEVTVVKSKASKELDKAVADFFKIKSDAAENYWLMGQKLIEINKGQLWKQRVNEEGKQRYKSWEAFVQAELMMTTQHAYRAMDVAKGYKDADEVREIGHTKAALILNAAPEDRQKLKAKAKAGATKRQIEADVQESRKKHGSPKKGKKAEAGKKGGETRSKKLSATAEKISVASIEGIQTIKLFKKPESIADFNPKKAERAVKLSDKPFGFVEMANGVMQYFALFSKEDGLYLKIQTARQSAGEEE